MEDEEDQPLSKPQLLKEEVREIIGNWDSVLKPQGYPPYFEIAEGAGIQAFDPSKEHFDPSNAWWLSELCRLVYTPDHKEGRLPWRDVIRFDYLADSPFEEIDSFHKTGTHAALYRCHPSGHPGDPYHVLCFRGTSRFRQWVLNLGSTPIRWHEGNSESNSIRADNKALPYVHSGFRFLFDLIWPLIEPVLTRMPGPLIFTGHSLGAALATMAAARRPPDCLYTFGSPRVGNTAFRDQLGHPRHFRVTNHHDIVTLLPHSIDTIAPFDFHHCGQLLYIDGDGEIQHDPSPEALANENWMPDMPLTYLASCFKGPHPPGCIQDHSPIEYSEKLAAITHIGTL